MFETLAIIITSVLVYGLVIDDEFADLVMCRK